MLHVTASSVYLPLQHAMTTVVLNSGSLYSAFIGTIDHLPCDVGRSLWLVQSLNLAIEKEKEKLHSLLTQEITSDVSAQFAQLKEKLLRWADESVAEMNALCEQLQYEEGILKEQVASLEKAAQAPATRDSEEEAKLREQLEAHYRQHPLASQVEARQERVLKDLGRVVVKQKPSSGIKIILKIPKRKDERKTHRPKIKLKVPEPEPEPEPEEQEELYCFCKQPSFGDMIGCDYPKCPNGEWFHYKCVGIRGKAEAAKLARQKWYCSPGCREAGELARKRKRKRRY